jgi:prevent-host-death family protein
MNLTTLATSNLQKSYKAVIEEVKKNKEPVILTTNNHPQAALVSLEDLEQLKQFKAKQAALSMLELAHNNKDELNKLPANLRAQADEILYSK